MSDTAIKNFAIEARRQLLKDVKFQMTRWAIDEKRTVPASADTLNGEVLSQVQRRQRAELLDLCSSKGSEQLAEQAAYTWFNRFLAIRFMELHDYLPCGLRFFSSPTGEFAPQVLKEALHADIEGIDRQHVAELISASGDDALFRYLFIAQCNELVSCLPAVFEKVGSAMELLLPETLLREGSVLDHLVSDIPESDWREGVEIIGWMYQYYVSERKDDFFNSKRKAAPEDIAPATQLFTPEWIVRYMVDNSLGRLWMLNHPDSHLRDRAEAEDPADRIMEYFIRPDEEQEDFIRVSSPEEITFCDPACGSGHILVYAFKVLMAIYEECGYAKRDIPALILTKNLFGMEIDQRAAQIASLALAMCAREQDRRFFSRGVSANITVLENIEFDEGELPETTELVQGKHLKLIEDLGHLGEIGSLLVVNEEELRCLHEDAETLTNQALQTGEMLLERTAKKLSAADQICLSLTRRFDVVVANPPYMGSSKFNAYMNKWCKKHYPDSCKDLCTAFIERGYSFGKDEGYCAMVTMQSWMFLGSFEKMRNHIIDCKTVVAMAHLGTRAFDAIAGEVVSVTAAVLHNKKSELKGCYVRLVDIAGSEPKRLKLLEAIQNPNCGWFYRANATTFHDIPGTPIVYWASKAVRKAFTSFPPLVDIAKPNVGGQTNNNDRFVRCWWEPSFNKSSIHCSSVEEAIQSNERWFPFNKGGSYRKWYGNGILFVDWENGGKRIKQAGGATTNAALYFRPSITWSRTSSGSFGVRFITGGFVFDTEGASIIADKEILGFLQGLLNSSVIYHLITLLAPTLHFGLSEISMLPISVSGNLKYRVIDIVYEQRELSKNDWDSQEVSWDYVRNPLI